MAEIQRDTTGNSEDTLRFLDLIGLFSSQAMMGLGKLANPMTGKAERNLPAARLLIDMLEMLERKTRGNLVPDEVKLLQSTLTDLRLMYVEETKNKPAEPTAPAPEPPKPEDSTPAANDDSKVKFQKKYD